MSGAEFPPVLRDGSLLQSLAFMVSSPAVGIDTS
jgi:hypothetical protein